MIEWLVLIFALGAAIGSFINVCVYRMPLEKSLMWPSSRCGRCCQPIKWYDNVPLLSYWILRGRCRFCGAGFSSRYFLVELFTGLLFAGLFYLDVIDNVAGYHPVVLGNDRYDFAVLATFAVHALLASFLLTASLIDYDHRFIPLSLTLTGTVVGLIVSVLFPWPWPYAVNELRLPPALWWLGPPIPEGFYKWPIWGPLPAWLPVGNGLGGLLTGLAGVLAGTLLLRVIRFLFGLGMGPDFYEDPAPDEAHWGFLRRSWSWLNRVGGKALGIGDADLMMMSGAFLGWQPTIVAFFVSVFPGLFVGIGQKFKGDDKLPFGPSLAIGVMLTIYGWPWLAPRVQPLFFNGNLVALVVITGSAMMLIAGFIIRFFKRIS
ncbi:MAG: A24 family peptidase [Gemmataceae bacterium]